MGIVYEPLGKVDEWRTFAGLPLPPWVTPGARPPLKGCYSDQYSGLPPLLDDSQLEGISLTTAKK